jgi:hypothetical protein
VDIDNLNRRIPTPHVRVVEKLHRIIPPLLGLGKHRGKYFSRTFGVWTTFVQKIKGSVVMVLKRNGHT